MKRLLIYIALCLFCLIYISPAKGNDSLSVGRLLNATDSLKIDSVSVKTNSSLDTIVKYESADSLIYNIKSKQMRLVSKAQIDYKSQKLKSDIIIIDFDKSLLMAYFDSTLSPMKRKYPEFSDAGQSFMGAGILYNFKTNQGTISLGETEMSDGFYYGKKIKRVSETELFVKDGCYTQCDADEPHYYFGSPKMKVVVKDKIFIDPIIFYVEDLPLLAIPFGLYFPTKTGRQSGLVIPSVFYSKKRGMALEDFGIYLAMSEYYDTEFLGKYYTKGGFNIENKTRWKLKNKFDGNCDLQFGKTRFNPDADYTKNWKFVLNHNQTLTPQSSFSANLNFASADFNRQTSNNLDDRVQSTISSRSQYSRSLDNGISYSIFFNREENIIDKTYSQTLPSVSLSVPTLYPFKSLIKPTSNVSWLRDLTFSYSGNAAFSKQKTGNGDSGFDYAHQNKIVHTPSVSVSPKLGYFTVAPFVSFRANNYFRRVTRTWSNADSAYADNKESGFFTEYNYSLGMNVSTTLWGKLKTALPGINYFKHQFKPSIGYSFSPDLSNPDLGFYGEYTNALTGNKVVYSRYVLDAGGIASRRLQNNLNYSFGNVFSMSIKQDTGKAKNVRLLNLDISGSYNFATDSMKMSDIGLSFSTPPIANFNFNGSANLTPYKYEKYNTGTAEIWHQVDKFIFGNGGIARMTALTLSMSTSFSNKGFFAGESKQRETDSVTFGERFARRLDNGETEYDIWGDHTPGYSRFSPPWSVNLNVYFTYRDNISSISRSLNSQINFTFKLTPTWNFSGSATYDVINKEFLSPSIKITKELHCWNLQFNWYPIGINRGFYFRFGANAQTLQDLKIEKRNNPLY